MRHFKAFTVASLILLPFSAVAADWTGGYAGLQIGTSDIDTNVVVTGDGNSFGAFAGYNFDMGTTVVGGEMDYDTTDYTLTGGAGTIDSTLRLKGRVGGEIGPGLGYLSAGWVRAETSAFGDDTGYFYGIGYDMPVAPNTFAGAEILQHEFENFGRAAGPDVSMMTIKLRVGFQF